MQKEADSKYFIIATIFIETFTPILSFRVEQILVSFLKTQI